MTCIEIKNNLENLWHIDLSTNTHRREFVEARWIYFYCCYKYSENYSQYKCGLEVGRDHASVHHGIAKVLEAKSMNFRFYESLQKLYKTGVDSISKKSRHHGKLTLEEKLDYYRRKYFELKLTA